jgi:hypothetical protein
MVECVRRSSSRSPFKPDNGFEERFVFLLYLVLDAFHLFFRWMSQCERPGLVPLAVTFSLNDFFFD